MPRTGRRPGQTRTRAKILSAARSRFAALGYDHATIRDIASAAGCDPALVMHFFGSKHGLFLAAMRLPMDPTTFLPELLAPGVDGLGARLVLTFVRLWDSAQGRPLVGLIRSVAGSQDAAKLMREFFSHAVVGRVMQTLRLDQPRLRGTLVASQLFGLAFARYVLKLSPIASASPDEVAALIGPTIQRYLTGELPRPVRRRKARIRNSTYVDLGNPRI